MRFYTCENGAVPHTFQRPQFYGVTRDLHLYLGLFISPFVVVFSVSVFFLVHAWLPGATARGDSPAKIRTGLIVPPNLQQLENRERVDAVRGVLDQLGVAGEIGFIQHRPKEHRMRMAVFVPGRETTVDLDYEQGRAEVSSRSTGLADALIYLHKAPGPHLTAIRGNWAPMRAWRWLADATVYLLLFITASGIYLWAVTRAQRVPGLCLIAAGAVSFFGLVYALSY